jgi:hypothetical protein
MEGNGAYNRHARLQAGGISLALPLLKKAIQDLDLDCHDQPVVVADYGSSQGKNSLAPVRVIIEGLRQRLGPHRSIIVYHIDQPSNDFNTLFTLLASDADTYTLNEPNVFPCAIGRSFYGQVLPSASVHMGWCSYAAVWLSRIPCRIRGHFIPIHFTGAERSAFERQAAQDWRTFLSLRSRELQPGGRLVVVLPAFNNEGLTGLEQLMDHANAVLAQMAEEGALGAEEREQMVLGACPRRTCELLAPFQSDGQFDGLSAECCELLRLEDFAWQDYERTRDREAFAARHALFFRSAFINSLALGLTKVHDPDRHRDFSDQLESMLKSRLAKEPAPLHSFVQIMVIAKRDHGA